MNSILVANRGEIALRIMRTAKRMGYSCIAVYSDPDADAPHVRMADAACRIGPAPARESYLNGTSILHAARLAGADAVHPGYGFLAENADFAQAVLDAGLVWIGPPPEAMRAIGNKAGAKRLLAQRDVPMLPGYQGTAQDDATLLREAARIGLPLMIKAAAGGGGRGMRLVHASEELVGAMARARSEAMQAFGSAELILEHALVAPRHVEVQVFADIHGNVVHMGERDCSVQRRHQKLIEEAPSPAVNPEQRVRLGAAALEVGRACGYVGAGTVEFLLDADGAFWFMEMNTRLQVEHPVTEAITGLDLVEWQLRVARGEALPLSQADIDARLAAGGHAIEVRLCAEDPVQDFLPQSGRIGAWVAPGSLRVEHALEDGIEASPDYDSMLAKLVAHGETREVARRKLLHGLADCVLLGITSNQDFLSDCLAHDEFEAGRATTAFVARYMAPYVRSGAGWETRCAAAALLLALREQGTARRYPAELGGWSSSLPFEDELLFELDGERGCLHARATGPGAWTLQSDQNRAQIHVEQSAPATLRLRIDGEMQEAFLLRIAAAGDAWHWRAGMRNHCVRDLAYLPALGLDAGNGGGLVRAPMNGKVTSLQAAPGDIVHVGQALMVLEAMKMEHVIAAPCGGRVDTVHVAAGDQVAPGMTLIVVSTDTEQGN
jgi:geranyl-CoA carboxylase alpha subunit